jgi:hypothetical protein
MEKNIATFRAWISNQMSNYDASHDIVHIDNVVSHCVKILNDFKLNNIKNNFETWETIYFATILTSLAHDVCDKKYVRNVKGKLSQLSFTLSRLGISLNIVTMVTNVVPRISFSKRLREGEPLDLTDDELFIYRVVSDADYLEAMGATGVVRTYMFQAVHGHTAKGAWTHTTQNLFKCYNYLFFDYSQKEGKIRLERMKRICDELEAERDFM